MIYYKGIEYPTRDLTIIIGGEETGITVATEALSEALGDTKEVNGSDEQEIDDLIYFYVLDDVIDLGDEVIAREHLDEPFELAKED